MKLLCISTAFKNTDIALNIDNKMSYSQTLSNAKQSENALVAIDALLKENKTKIQDIDSVSVVIGPGSFTGIRIGIGLAKGMAVAKPDLKLVAICSLDLMAYIFKRDCKLEQDFYCILNALSGNIFARKYTKDGEAIDEPKMLTGDEITLLRGTIVGLEDENLSICNQKVSFTPQSLLELSTLYYSQGKFVSENNLLPLYLRKSQAEMNDANKKN